MPFAEELSDVYRYLIADGLSNLGYDVRRADDILSQNNILSDSLKDISIHSVQTKKEESKDLSHSNDKASK